MRTCSQRLRKAGLIATRVAMARLHGRMTERMATQGSWAKWSPGYMKQRIRDVKLFALRGREERARRCWCPPGQPAPARFVWRGAPPAEATACVCVLCLACAVYSTRLCVFCGGASAVFITRSPPHATRARQAQRSLPASANAAPPTLARGVASWSPISTAPDLTTARGELGPSRLMIVHKVIRAVMFDDSPQGD